MTDRTYARLSPLHRTWHADEAPRWDFFLCGRLRGSPLDVADRLPPNGHLCGSCARIIAARADIEDTTYGVVAPI